MALTNAERQKLYREKYPGIEKRRRRELRVEVLTHYGNGKLACVKCGFGDIRALSIDHIEGRKANEYTQRRRGEKTTTAIDGYRKLKRDGYPNGYQTLCMNCQWVKRYESFELLKREDRPVEIHWWEA